MISTYVPVTLLERPWKVLVWLMPSADQTIAFETEKPLLRCRGPASRVILPLAL
jgi:hypothetical protein